MNMSATKRKFTALLRDLGETRQGEYDTVLDTNNLLAKRRRLGFPNSTVPSFLIGSAQSTASSHSAVSTRRQVRYKTQPHAFAKYSPADRDELLNRLSTFQEITNWTPKPRNISEIEWAKRGWICKGKERVRCILCHKELLVKLDSKSANEDLNLASAEPSGQAKIAMGLADKYAELIVSAHDEDCLWRKRGCDGSLLRLSLANANISLENLRSRYEDLLARSKFLPLQSDLRLPVDMDVNSALAQLPSNFFRTADSTIPPAQQASHFVAFALALCGWQGLKDDRIGTVLNSAACQTCLRRLGLWMFRAKETGIKGAPHETAAMEQLDPIWEHRSFCPWKNSDNQKRAGQDTSEEPCLTGWETLLQTLKNNAHLQDIQGGHPAVASPLPFHANGERSEEQMMRDDGRSSVTGKFVEVLREQKDKERWARLKKVKSLFDIKGGRKLKRAHDRPITSHEPQSPRPSGFEPEK